MGLFSTPPKTERLVAIFDIGSGSVGGAIARIPLDGKSIPSIIQSARTEIVFQNELNFTVFLADMLTALTATATELYKSKVGAPEEIICVMASPWYLSETRTIKMSRENSFVFTKRLAEELFQKELTQVKEMYQKKYGGVESAPSVIEHQTLGISLNGYTIADPFGKRTRSLEMNMVISLSPKVCLEGIQKALSPIYHSTPISFSSFTVASYIAVRDRYIGTDSYLLVDISGEITDIGVVRRGILTEVLSFPFGKRTFFKYMCSKMNIELRDAQESLSLYTSGMMSTRMKNKLTPLFTSIENSWRESFRQCLSALPQSTVQSQTTFLTADVDIRDWFASVIRNELYNNGVEGSTSGAVVTLEGPEFLQMCSVKSGLCDPFLMIEAIAVMRKKETRYG